MRARNIKPAIFKNEILGVADPFLTILFEGLWCLADREGRLEDRPLRIKAEILPYREGLDINGYLTELERLEFICRYKVENKAFIEVLNFRKHQAPHKTEKGSVIPPMSKIDSGEAKEDEIEEKKPTKPKGCKITVKQPLNNGEITEALPPDSLIPDSLIPDSLIPEKHSPAEAEQREAEIPRSQVIIKKQETSQEDQAWQAVQYLNSKLKAHGSTGRGYQKSKSSLKNANARLKEKFTLAELKQVIDFKFDQWIFDPNQSQYLRPQTLFSEKFESYLQAASYWTNPATVGNVHPIAQMSAWDRKIQARNAAMGIEPERVIQGELVNA